VPESVDSGSQRAEGEATPVLLVGRDIEMKWAEGGADNGHATQET
jgi:hypothetical protein